MNRSNFDIEYELLLQDRKRSAKNQAIVNAMMINGDIKVKSFEIIGDFNKKLKSQE